MLETMIFREIRYNENNEQLLKENLKKIAENPNDIEVLQTLASIYHALKENDKAIEIYEKLVKLKPENYTIRAFLGYLYYETEDLDNAEKCFEEVLDNISEPFVMFLLGNVYARKGKISTAVAHIDFARKYEHMGRHKAALKEYKAAYEIDSRDEGLVEKIEYLEEKCKNNTENKKAH